MVRLWPIPLPTSLPRADLAIVGAGVSGCALAASLRRRGWCGSIELLEIGRGPGGRAATRYSRQDPDLRINHGAPLFNIRAQTPPELLQALEQREVISPFRGSIQSLDGQRSLGPAIDDGFSDGQLWQGRGGMDALAAGLLELAEAEGGVLSRRFGTLVRHLRPERSKTGLRWTLENSSGEALVEARWLVLSGTLLAHPRCQQVFGWDGIPLEQAAESLADPQLNAAQSQLASIEGQASCNLLLTLPPEQASTWLELPWHVLQCTPSAQERWGLRRISIQPLAGGRCAVVAESSPAFAAAHLHVYGSRSSAAQLLGAKPDPSDESRVLDAQTQALTDLSGQTLRDAPRQLMRWGAAFPLAPGLDPGHSCCPESAIGFCGDSLAGDGFGRIEGALLSAEDLATELMKQL